MNGSRYFAALGCAIGLILALSVSSPGQAQTITTKPATKLPSATKILDDAALASGGKSAYANLNSLVMKGKITIAAQKINGTFESRMVFPDKVYLVQEIGGFGKFEQGFDGKTGWSRDPINGLRDLTGAELKQMKREGESFKNSDWRQQYSKPELLGIRKVGTADAYAIRLTPNGGGKPVVTYYDVKTKLPIQTDLVVESPQGSIPTQNFSSDFRTIKGLKIPFKTRQVVGGTQEITQTFDSVEFNVPVESGIFAKPAAPAPKVDTTKP